MHQRLDTWGRKLMSELTARAAELGVPLRCEGFPSAFWFVFDGRDRAASDAAAETLGLTLRSHQVVQYHHTWLSSASHDDEALAFTLDRFGSALTELLTRGALS